MCLTVIVSEVLNFFIMQISFWHTMAPAAAASTDSINPRGTSLSVQMKVSNQSLVL